MSSIPFYARRFVSGTTFKEALPVLEKLNQSQIAVTLDVLGENVKDKSAAIQFCEEYETIIKKMGELQLNCYVSIKLTMLGLDIDPEFCYKNFAKILVVADKYKIRVAMDMESSDYTERTLMMYERSAKEFWSPEIVLQAYLLRTESDTDRVLNANGRLRLCKGAYKEPSDKAFQKMPQIVENYKKLIGKMLVNGKRVCIATHDDKIIHYCMDFIEQHQIPKDRYEFQMLYGMREKTWHHIREKGHNMTIYVPYGTHWQAYFSRRLAERKENIFFVLKNFFKS